MRLSIESTFVSITTSVRELIACIDRGAHGIALVVDAERRLIGTVTDGDVRRGMLATVDLEVPISTILERKVGTQYSRPITARLDAGRDGYWR